MNRRTFFGACSAFVAAVASPFKAKAEPANSPEAEYLKKIQEICSHAMGCPILSVKESSQYPIRLEIAFRNDGDALAFSGMYQMMQYGAPQLVKTYEEQFGPRDDK